MGVLRWIGLASADDQTEAEMTRRAKELLSWMAERHDRGLKIHPRGAGFESRALQDLYDALQRVIYRKPGD